jgi:hypothetical protein
LGFLPKAGSAAWIEAKPKVEATMMSTEFMKLQDTVGFPFSGIYMVFEIGFTKMKPHSAFRHNQRKTFIII